MAILRLFIIKQIRYCVQLLLNTYNSQRVNICVNIGILIKIYLITVMKHNCIELFSNKAAYVNYVHNYIISITLFTFAVYYRLYSAKCYWYMQICGL